MYIYCCTHHLKLVCFHNQLILFKSIFDNVVAGVFCWFKRPQRLFLRHLNRVLCLLVVEVFFVIRMSRSNQLPFIPIRS